MMKRLAIMAVLLTGLFLTGTSQTNAQANAETYCVRRFDDTRHLEYDEKIENIDCWLKKVKSGEKNLTEAVLRRVMLIKADLSKADLFKADLERADLEGANLSNSNLGKANLTDATLTGADLREAILTGADLTRADLTGADLRGAKSRGLTWTEATVSRKSTQGINFEAWKRGGGIVVD